MINVMMSSDSAADVQSIIDAVNAKAVETQTHITTKNTETKALVQTENDATQQTLSNITTGDDLNANTVNVNNHTSTKIDEVKAHVTSEVGGISVDSDYAAKANFVDGSNTSDVYGSAIKKIGVSSVVLTTIYQRNGSGVLEFLRCVRDHIVEVWLDGKKVVHKNVRAANSSGEDLVSATVSGVYQPIPYKQRIEIKAYRVTYDGSNVEITDYITGVA